VEIKLIAPKIEDIPAMCKEKIVRSIEGPLWYVLAARGGYTVHPVPAPVPTYIPIISNINEGGKSQNLMLFIRG